MGGVSEMVRSSGGGGSSCCGAGLAERPPAENCSSSDSRSSGGSAQTEMCRPSDCSHSSVSEKAGLPRERGD